MEIQTGSLLIDRDLDADGETDTCVILTTRTYGASSTHRKKKCDKKLTSHFPSRSVIGAGMSGAEMQNRDEYCEKASAGNHYEVLHGQVRLRPPLPPRVGSFVIYQDIEKEGEAEAEVDGEAEGVTEYGVGNIEEQLDEIIAGVPVLEKTKSRVKCRAPSPLPRSPSLSQRQWPSGESSLCRSRKRVQRSYQSTTVSGRKNTGLELEVSVAPPSRPLLATLRGPPPSTVGEPLLPGMEEDCSKWQDLELNQGAETVDVLPHGRTTRLLPLSSLTSSSGYVYSSIDKENEYIPSCNGPGGFDTSEEDVNVASMDISLPESPCLPRAPSPPACSLLSPATPPLPADTTNSTTTPFSSCPASGEDSDSEGSVGPENVDGSLADLPHLEYQRPRPRNLRSLHASIMSLIDRDCSYLIKHGLLPYIRPPYPGSTTENIHTVSLHFQNHLRTCISSFRIHLITWQTALQSCMPPRQRKIILPECLTLVPSFTRLVLELNIRVNTPVIVPSQQVCTLYNEQTNTNTSTNITTTQLTFSGKKSARTCPPNPVTPNYALSKLTLAELCIAAYLSEVETYQHKLPPRYSAPVEPLLRTLLCRARKEAEPGVEEANTCCIEMWKGQWGILDCGEHDKLSCGSRELGGATGARKAVRGREETVAVVGKRGKRSVSSGSAPVGKKKRWRDKRAPKKEQEGGEQERKRKKENDRLIEQRSQLAREFTWRWEDGVVSTT